MPLQHDELGGTAEALLGGYFVCIFLLSAYFILRILHVERTWTTADWLINYRGGFVRRGLPGECLYQAHRLTHLSYEVLLGAVLLTLQGGLLASWYAIVRKAPLQVWLVAVLVSPATLNFALLDFSGGFRKELVFLAATTGLLAVLQRVQLSVPALTACLAVIVLASSLSHEGTLFYLPYLFAVPLVCGYSMRQTALACVIPTVLGLLAGIASATHKGSLATAEKICSSLGYTLNHTAPNDVCDYGAMWYLALPGRHAFEQTMEITRANHSVRHYLLWAVLSVAPLVLGSIGLKRRGVGRTNAVCWIAAGLAFAASLLLFFLALDWGRWIHMHVLLLGALLATTAARNRERIARPAWPVGVWRRAAAVLALSAYATGWMMPVIYVSQALPGYRGTARQMLTRRGVRVPWE